jgi:hypothetical protein
MIVDSFAGFLLKPEHPSNTFPCVRLTIRFATPYNYDKEKREVLTKWAEMLLAATWPAAQNIYTATGKPEYEWDFSTEWDRMKF